MPEALPDQPISKKKYFLVLFVIMAVFLTVAPYLLGAVFSVVYPTTDVALDTPLADAQVTDVWRNRQQCLYYLDGSAWWMNDFSSFVPADPAGRTGMDDAPGYDYSSLAHHLRRGDRLIKAANSPLLTVRRGAIITHWILFSATPEGKVSAPERSFITNEDSVVIP